MGVTERVFWNARYSKFYLMRFSESQGKYIRVGKPRQKIEDALAAAKRMDGRTPKWMTFIDVDRRQTP